MKKQMLLVLGVLTIGVASADQLTRSQRRSLQKLVPNLEPKGCMELAIAINDGDLLKKYGTIENAMKYVKQEAQRLGCKESNKALKEDFAEFKMEMNVAAMTPERPIEYNKIPQYNKTPRRYNMKDVELYDKKRELEEGKKSELCAMSIVIAGQLSPEPLNTEEGAHKMQKACVDLCGLTPDKAEEMISFHKNK